MPTRRHGRAAPIAGPVGLIVCVACAVTAAGPTLVPPDEAAGLSAVAAASFGVWCSVQEDVDDAWVAGPKDEVRGPEGDAFTLLVLDRASPIRGHAPSGLGPATHVGSVSGDNENGCHGWLAHPCERRSTPGTAAQATRGTPLEFAPPQAVDPAEIFIVGDLPPVVRAQSADIELLSLAGGAAPVETTSMLSWVTGTQGRIRADYLTDFDETDRIGVQALTQSWLGFGLDAEANYWQRPVAGLGREPLWTGDLNLIYNLVPHPRFKFRSGMGAAWTLDDGKPHAGYNITHGLDVYLLWRAMAIGEIDWGKLDDDDLFRYRLALGLTYDSFEFFSGYESYKLGGEKLDGWVNGVAWWY